LCQTNPKENPAIKLFFRELSSAAEARLVPKADIITFDRAIPDTEQIELQNNAQGNQGAYVN